jgi:hypothetical protein
LKESFKIWKKDLSFAKGSELISKIHSKLEIKQRKQELKTAYMKIIKNCIFKSRI